MIVAAILLSKSPAWAAPGPECGPARAEEPRGDTATATACPGSLAGSQPRFSRVAESTSTERTSVAPWPRPRAGGVPQGWASPAGHRVALLTGFVQNKCTKHGNMGIYPCGHTTLHIKNRADMLCFVGKRTRDPSVILLLLFRMGCKLPDGASPADKAGRQKAAL